MNDKGSIDLEKSPGQTYSKADGHDNKIRNISNENNNYRKKTKTKKQKIN